VEEVVVVVVAVAAAMEVQGQPEEEKKDWQDHFLVVVRVTVVVIQQGSKSRMVLTGMAQVAQVLVLNIQEALVVKYVSQSYLPTVT